MLIEVVIVEWALACCGDPFAVGKRATWVVRAAEPNDSDMMRRFIEDSHDLTPTGIPLKPVGGVVRSIEAVYDCRLPIAGDTASTNDPTDVVRVQIRRAPTEDELEGRGLAEYVVVLDIADDAELPMYVEDHALAEFRKTEQLAREAATARSRDAVGQRLTDLADRLQIAYSDQVEFLRSDDGFSALPRASEACPVRWRRSEEAIIVRIGAGTWEIKPDLEGVRLLEGMVEEAVGGDVEELVTDFGLQTLIGTFPGALEKFSPPHKGPVVAPKTLMDRWRRGDFRYRPW